MESVIRLNKNRAGEHPPPTKKKVVLYYSEEEEGMEEGAGAAAFFCITYYGKVTTSQVDTALRVHTVLTKFQRATSVISSDLPSVSYC
jgi:hypothetical protein